MVLVKPHCDLAGNVIFHDRIGVVRTRTPRRIVASGSGFVIVEINSARMRWSVPSIEFIVRKIKRPPMIVDDVENHRQTLLMTCVDKCFQVVRAAVLVVVDRVLVGWGIRVSIDAVELGYWKQ